jgi:putative redox protein
MELTIRYRGNKKFEANARGHLVITDQPFQEGGRDAGMTPPELFLSAMGACAGHYAAEYLNVRGLPSEDLQIGVRAVKALNPARISSIQIEVITDCLNPRHREGLQRAVDHCLLHNTLLFPPTVDIKIVTGRKVPELESALVT